MTASSTSETMWGQFWSFQRSSLFCKTTSVVEQLRLGGGSSSASSSGNKRNKGLSSLKLVGADVSGVQYNLEALIEALQQNTSLQSVSICGSFVGSLRRNYSSAGGEEQHLTRSLFAAIGALPNLTKVSLQGNEDSEPVRVEYLTALLEAASSNSRSNNDINNNWEGQQLEEFSCTYVDLVGSSHEQVDRLGQALGKCTALRKVAMVSMSLHIVGPSSDHSSSDPIPTLDPLLSRLGHCLEVELGMRYRPANATYISSKALHQLLVAPPSPGSNNGLLQKLTLRRRIPVTEGQLSTILKALHQHTPTLKEIQLDEVCISSLSSAKTTATSSIIWQDMATMLRSNTTLETLELGFAGDENAQMDAAAVQDITSALKLNTSLKRLSLRGIKSTSSVLQPPAQCWLQMLEDDNYNLQELDVFQQQENNSNNDTAQRASFVEDRSNSHITDCHERMEFYLQLNRQCVKMPDGTNTSRLRSLLRSHNGALPQELMVPCMEAAMEIPDFWGYREPAEDDFFEDCVFDRDCDGGRGLGGLFYLLSQQLSIVFAVKDRLEVFAKKQAMREENEGHNHSFLLERASPQLLLLDDNIVALW